MIIDWNEDDYFSGSIYGVWTNSGPFVPGGIYIPTYRRRRR